MFYFCIGSFSVIYPTFSCILETQFYYQGCSVHFFKLTTDQRDRSRQRRPLRLPLRHHAASLQRQACLLAKDLLSIRKHLLKRHEKTFMFQQSPNRFLAERMSSKKFTLLWKESCLMVLEAACKFPC